MTTTAVPVPAPSDAPLSTAEAEARLRRLYEEHVHPVLRRAIEGAPSAPSLPS